MDITFAGTVVEHHQQAPKLLHRCPIYSASGLTDTEGG
jgi:uncharacterized protein (DUF305 family)